AVWAAERDSGKVARIDPATNKVVATIQLDPEVNNIAELDGSVWATSHAASKVYRIDPATNLVARTYELPAPVGPVSVTPSAVWVASPTADLLRRIDPATGDVVATIQFAGATRGGPVAPAYANGSAWVCNHNPGTPGTAAAYNQDFEVSRIDLSTNTIAGEVA